MFDANFGPIEQILAVLMSFDISKQCEKSVSPSKNQLSASMVFEENNVVVNVTVRASTW